MADAHRVWVCGHCQRVYVSPLPVRAVRCECSKRAGRRDYWMTPRKVDE